MIRTNQSTGHDYYSALGLAPDPSSVPVELQSDSVDGLAPSLLADPVAPERGPVCRTGCRSCSNAGTAPRTGLSPAATYANAWSRPDGSAKSSRDVGHHKTYGGDVTQWVSRSVETVLIQSSVRNVPIVLRAPTGTWPTRRGRRRGAADRLQGRQPGVLRCRRRGQGRGQHCRFGYRTCPAAVCGTRPEGLLDDPGCPVGDPRRRPVRRRRLRRLPGSGFQHAAVRRRPGRDPGQSGRDANRRSTRRRTPRTASAETGVRPLPYQSDGFLPPSAPRQRPGTRTAGQDVAGNRRLWGSDIARRIQCAAGGAAPGARRPHPPRGVSSGRPEQGAEALVA
jgi:hypothetical protein